jgi:hypothetical protein
MTVQRAMPRLLSGFTTLAVVFIGLRVLLLLAYQPLLIDNAERGVTVGGDYLYYYLLVQPTDAGLYPFRDWWSEFPPLWSVIEVGLYRLLGGEASYGSYATLLAGVMLACDFGNFVLLRLMGIRLYGETEGQALAWVYALLLAPLVFAFWTFEPLVVVFLLLGLWLLLRGRDVSSAVVAGLGALTKFVPALLFGAVIRFRAVRASAIYIVIAVAVFAVPYAVLLANPSTRQMTLPSLTAQFNKASYQTVWALLDGNLSTGVFGSVSERTDVTNATLPRGNPPVVPGIVRLAGAAAVGLFIFVRTRRTDERGVVAFVLVTLLIFYLQSQGWSPQWLVGILPLTLLCFPTARGVQVCVLLSLVTFAEYPLLFIRTGATGGVISGELVLPFTVLVLVRTAILVGLVVALYRVLRGHPAAV